MARHHSKQYHEHKNIIRSLKAKADGQRSLSAKIADVLTVRSGSMAFLIVNMTWFVVWIVINLGIIPGLPVFDPFPFGLLTMIVSLEAIGLAIIVLISQNRESQVADWREETDLQIDMMSERELTKLLELVVLIAKKHDIDLSKDKDLQEMLKYTDTDKLEEVLEREVVTH